MGFARVEKLSLSGLAKNGTRAKSEKRKRAKNAPNARGKKKPKRLLTQPNLV